MREDGKGWPWGNGIGEHGATGEQGSGRIRQRRRRSWQQFPDTERKLHKYLVMMRETPATSAQSLTGKGLTVSQVSARVYVRERAWEKMMMRMYKKKETCSGEAVSSRSPQFYDINISWSSQSYSSDDQKATLTVPYSLSLVPTMSYPDKLS